VDVLYFDELMSKFLDARICPVPVSLDGMAGRRFDLSSVFCLIKDGIFSPLIVAPEKLHKTS
jgi:hypothetical protein